MKTFEEWWVGFPVDNKLSGPKKDFESIFKSAREGMIPADRAIEVPEVWPDFASHIDVLFRSADRMTYQTITTIPRPVPAWCPKVGDAVFIDGRTDVEIGRILDDNPIFGDGTRGHGWFIWVLASGKEWGGSIDAMKPFDASKIGKPWSEI